MAFKSLLKNINSWCKPVVKGKSWQEKLEHRHKKVVERVDRQSMGPPRAPWKLLSEFSVGGLWANEVDIRIYSRA